MPKVKTTTEEPVVETAKVTSGQLYLLSVLTQDEATLDELTKNIEKFDGQIKKAESLGRKILAYPINKHSELTLMSVFFELQVDQVAPLERVLKHEDFIERYLLTKWNAELPTPHHHHQGRNGNRSAHSFEESKEKIEEEK